jgi:hypothetical protein
MFMICVRMHDSEGKTVSYQPPNRKKDNLALLSPDKGHCKATMMRYQSGGQSLLSRIFIATEEIREQSMDVIFDTEFYVRYFT